MTSQFEADMRKLKWEASKRAQRTGMIEAGPVERALELHIAGRYEDAIELLLNIPDRERTASAWRVLGHAELGRGNFQEAIAAHRTARKLNAKNPSDVADDDVNLAAVFIAMESYTEAWEATERASQLAPESIAPWTPRISILNRQGKRAELRSVISDLLERHPHVINDPVFLDHVENDVDFVGVKELIAELTNMAKEKL